MDKIVKIGAEEASKGLLKNTSVNISLEGWPCAVAIIGVGVAYAISIKFKYDTQRNMSENSKVTNMETRVNVA